LLQFIIESAEINNVVFNNFIFFFESQSIQGFFHGEHRFFFVQLCAMTLYSLWFNLLIKITSVQECDAREAQ